MILSIYFPSDWTLTRCVRFVRWRGYNIWLDDFKRMNGINSPIHWQTLI